MNSSRMKGVDEPHDSFKTKGSLLYKNNMFMQFLSLITLHDRTVLLICLCLYLKKQYFSDYFDSKPASSKGCLMCKQTFNWNKTISCLIERKILLCRIQVKMKAHWLRHMFFISRHPRAKERIELFIPSAYNLQLSFLPCCSNSFP